MAQFSCLMLVSTILVCQSPTHSGSGADGKPIPGSSSPRTANLPQGPAEFVLKAIRANPLCSPYEIEDLMAERCRRDLGASWEYFCSRHRGPDRRRDWVTRFATI